DGVVGGDGAEGDDVGGDLDLVPHGEALDDALAGHGEDADLDVRGVGALEGLVVPLDLFKRERDLLDGLELDDVLDLPGVDRGELGEAGEGGVAGDGDGDARAGEVVLLGEGVDGE